MNDGTDEKKIKKNQVIFAVLIGLLVGAILVTCIVLGFGNGFGFGGSGSSNDNASSMISVSGTHELKGEYQCLTVKTTNDVKLILNNASITCENGPAIYIEESGDVEIVLKGENTISVTTNDDLEGAIHSKEDLVFSGDGSLKLTGNLDGIVSKDTLTFNGGNYTIETGDDAIKGKDNVIINGGVFNLTSSGGDGIKASNDEDTKLGYIKISDGEITIDAANDGIQAETNITIDDGKITIKCGDDAIHANGKLEINGGEISIDAHEGLEATYIILNDGTIDIVATDDGMNAGSKSDLYNVAIEINGGKLTIDMGNGDTDAIDSNGALKITGGTINIKAMSPFDYDGDLTFSGGTLIVNGETVDTITNQFGGDMGGPGMQGGQLNGGQPGMNYGPNH